MFVRTTVLSAALAATALLTGCGDDGSTGHAGHTSTTSSVAAAAHNDADIRFAQEMIPHHRQAVAMAELAPSRAADPRVLALAERVRAAQDPEIATMTGWLETWGAPRTAPGHEGMDHGSAGMSGMLGEAEMARLEAARGAAFDRLWLSGMIAHHEGAVAMARAELDGGADAGAVALARRIIDAQEAEIAEMRGLLEK